MRPILYLALVGLIVIIVGISSYIDPPGQDGGFRFNLVWIVPLSVFGIECLERYRCRWYYWRTGKEIGTFSAYQLHQLYKTGKIDSKTPIRQVKDKDWHTGTTLENPPRRLVRGLCFALLAGLLGFFLCFALFGQVRGIDGERRYMSLDSILTGPSESEIVLLGWGSQMRLEQYAEQRIIALGLSGFPLVGQPMKTLGDAGDQAVSHFMEKLETARTSTLCGTVLLTLLGAIGGAITAKQRPQIIKERRVVFKKRYAEGEVPS